jgi:hypothetical protein
MTRTTTIKLLASALVAGTLLGGCADIYYDRRETVAFGANDAVETNKATHVIDPWPRAAANRNITHDGHRMQTAVGRYRANAAPAAAPATTTMTIQSSGGPTNP